MKCRGLDRKFFPDHARARGGVIVDASVSRPLSTPAICGAQTRKGTQCRAKALPGKARCKFHGGASTGPKTQKGRDRIAEAQRRRWAAWRAIRTTCTEGLIGTTDNHKVQEMASHLGNVRLGCMN